MSSRARKVNILEHELVPQHILLSEEEAKRILKRMGISKMQLPWMLASDPVAKALGAKPGDVVMILRKSPTAGVAVAFRYVVRG
ncbi:MAG: DNA-directed RNA polymerase subunit H [Thermofilum sp.]|jgi:DNA-directed RNA polymerase subunit H|nr:DNA-directed RNA polymerase subunit H [Thermofilum sp.]MCC6064643.1 DNA-directed RNA polymerase subunit H [Thermofilum sp.]